VTIVYLMRHGQSRANVERVFSNGRVDLPLTDQGREQARRAAQWFRGRGIRHVFSAPLLRARETAGILAAELGVGVTVLPDLDEVRVGQLDGRRDDESWAAYDRAIARWRAGEREAAFPGGETFGRACDRYAAALGEIGGRFPEGAVVAVSHGAIQLTVLPRLCPDLAARFERGEVAWELGTAAITTLERAPDRVACAEWGFVGHLERTGPATGAGLVDPRRKR
jgi:broad specificity phosphatase PhoE